MVRIGLWGTFDVEHLGDALVPRVVRAELTRRVPGAEVVSASPLGYLGSNRYEDDHPAAPLGVWTDARVDELARQLDVLVIGAGSIVHGDDARLAPWYGLAPDELEGFAPSRFFIEGVGKHEVDVPTAWFAVEVEPDATEELETRWRTALAARVFVGVRDEPSRDRLREAGVDRAIEIVPDPTLLLPRILSTPALSARIDRLRASGAYPEGEAIVVQGGTTELAHVDEIVEVVASLAADRNLTPVVVESEPIHGDRTFADAVLGRLPSARRFPSDAGVDDVAAAIAWAAGIIGRSRSLHVLAAAYDRPAVLVDLDDAPRFADLAVRLGTPERRVISVDALRRAYDEVVARGSVAAQVDEAIASLDEGFDRLAGLASDVELRAEVPPAAAPGPTLADERERYAIATRSLAARMAATQEAFAERERDLRRYADAVNRELVERDIRFTKLWRRVHEGDRHYHYHEHRANEAELRIDHLEREIEFLRGETVRPWLRRRVRLFLWWLRPTPVGRALAKARVFARRGP